MVDDAEQIVLGRHTLTLQELLVLNVWRHIQVVQRKLDCIALLAVGVSYFLESLQLNDQNRWESKGVQRFEMDPWDFAALAVHLVLQLFNGMVLAQTALKGNDLVLLLDSELGSVR